MTTKIEIALELKGIAYDAYNARESFLKGGPLQIVDSIANATTFFASISGLAGIGGLTRDIIAFKANEIKFSLSLTKLLAESNKTNPDAAVVGQAFLGLVSSSAGILGAIPGIPPHIKLSANLIALAVDGISEGIGRLPQLLSDLDSQIKASGANEWTFDGDPFTGMPWPGISPTVNKGINDALALDRLPPVVSCPLILDLDGGGISNSGIQSGYPILFDHDGDGLRNATGWVGAGEAIVVRDLDGNGTIDSGRELFGDNTSLTRGPKAGQRAANGFEALADLDSNNDGQFNAADAAFASVKLWKDANQNGISEAGELFTFAQLGVQGIKVAGWVDGTRLTDADGELTGNRQILAGTFTWGNGGNGQAASRLSINTAKPTSVTAANHTGSQAVRSQA